MSDKLKKFVNDNKEEFDSQGPSNRVWDKIDAGMQSKNYSWIKSKKLAKYFYFGFGLSSIVLSIYFLVNTNSTHVSVAERQDLSNTISEAKINGYASNSGQNNSSVNKANSRSSAKYPNTDANTISYETDTAHVISETDILLSENEDAKIENATANMSAKEMTAREKKRNDIIKNRKNKSLYIPEYPEKVSSYEGTIYDSNSFCNLLGAFKLYGDVQVDHGKLKQDGKDDHVRIRGVSCNYLANIPDLKAIWLKGKTNEKLKLSIGKDFKNIILLKNDGSKINPTAISHYYPGIGAIGEFKGKFFNIVFTDKVELILFFKNVEAGDKIFVDEKLEVIAKDQP